MPCLFRLHITGFICCLQFPGWQTDALKGGSPDRSCCGNLRLKIVRWQVFLSFHSGSIPLVSHICFQVDKQQAFLHHAVYLLSGAWPTVKLEGRVPKTAFISDTNCRFKQVHQTILSFNNMLEGLIEIMESCYAHGYSLLQEKHTD